MSRSDSTMSERYDGTLRDVFTELRPWEWPLGVAWICAVRTYEFVRRFR